MKLEIYIIVLLYFSFHISAAQVATDSVKSNQLQEVIITGTRTQRSVATLPLPTQIITGESIRKSGLSRLNEIIQEQTGLITVPDFGGGEGIQMQGSRRDSLYSWIKNQKKQKGKEIIHFSRKLY